MELRNGSLVGGSAGPLPAHLRSTFEEAVGLVFHRWTALNLAVDNQWGGAHSRQLAEDLYAWVLQWFYAHADHHADDLELELGERMSEDFSVDLEDDSDREVAKELVRLHHDIMHGKSERLEALRRTAPLPTGASRREQVDHDGTVVGSGDSSDSSGDDSNADMDASAPPTAPAAPAKPAPVVDADGFQLVQGRRRGRGPQSEPSQRGTQATT